MAFGSGAIASAAMLALVLAGLPLDVGAPRCAGADDRWGASATELRSFEALIAELDRSVATLTDSIAAGAPDPGAREVVEAALDGLRFWPLAVAESPGGEAEAKIRRALAVLAAASLGEDPGEAARWMDAALARPGPGIVEVEGLGPALSSLHDTRRDALAAAGTARLGVLCDFPCKVVVDGHVLGGGGEYPLALGVHDVWVFAVTDRGTFADFEIIEAADSGDGTCLFFPRSGGLALLSSPAQWWAAVDYARRLDWAMDCQDLPDGGFAPELLATILAEAPDHTSVLARDESLRMLRVDAAFTLARAIGEAGLVHVDAILRTTTLDALPLDARAAEFGSEFEQMYGGRRAPILDGPRGTIELICHEPCVATIDQVRVEPGRHRVPVGHHDVRIYDAAAVEAPVSAAVEVEDAAVHPLSFGEPPAPPPPKIDEDEPLRDPETLQRMPPRTRALVFGLAGGLSLVGGAAWGLAIAAGGLSNEVRSEDVDLSEGSVVNVGLIAGAAGVHVVIAAVMFGLTVKAKPRKNKTKTKSRKQAGAGPVIGPGPGAVGLSLSGRF